VRAWKSLKTGRLLRCRAHDRQDGCALSPKGPHTESGIAVAGELHSTQPWGYRLRFFWAAASGPPEHKLRNERTLSESTGGGQIKWKMHGLRSGQWTGPWRCWWRGVKGKVCDGRALTLVAVRDPTALEDCWKEQWGETDPRASHLAPRVERQC
jgi:hypothetical protein